jgi:hypothetical protein
MSIAALIVPDNVTVSFALSTARELGWVLQTNGRRSCIAPELLPHYGRIAGGGDRACILCEARTVHTTAPGPEAA